MQQHCLPAGDGRHRPAQAVSGPAIAKEGAFFDEAEKIPLGGVVREEWRKAVVDERGRVERIPYELCVLVSLRRREIWVPGANRWRNPEDDLPPDFEDNRDVHYDAIRQPQDPEKFIEAHQKRLREALTRFDAALEPGTTGGVDIVRKHASRGSRSRRWASRRNRRTSSP
ncbi:hypothetical protein AB0D13_39690 [Streptomyces sp. NPDC048430]|uniref:hypothetical protein n=1 Tax=unclassified Streptomyces TaxID=2593676 RepID=UPI00344A3488